MRIGEYIESNNKKYKLIMQHDGNLVLYNDANTPLWSSVTPNMGGYYFQLQYDGNLVLYTSANAPLWASNTSKINETEASVLILNDDGSLRLLKGNSLVWFINYDG